MIIFFCEKRSSDKIQCMFASNTRITTHTRARTRTYRLAVDQEQTTPVFENPLYGTNVRNAAVTSTIGKFMADAYDECEPSYEKPGVENTLYDSNALYSMHPNDFHDEVSFAQDSSRAGLENKLYNSMPSPGIANGMYDECELPTHARRPTMSLSTSSTTDVLYIGMTHRVISPQITVCQANIV